MSKKERELEFGNRSQNEKQAVLVQLPVQTSVQYSPAEWKWTDETFGKKKFHLICIPKRFFTRKRVFFS